MGSRNSFSFITTSRPVVELLLAQIGVERLGGQEADEYDATILPYPHGILGNPKELNYSAP
jgi:hypothetical protein